MVHYYTRYNNNIREVFSLPKKIDEVKDERYTYEPIDREAFNSYIKQGCKEVSLNLKYVFDVGEEVAPVAGVFQKIQYNV